VTKGAIEADLSVEVHEHDLERAEDPVQELALAAMRAEGVALIPRCAQRDAGLRAERSVGRRPPAVTHSTSKQRCSSTAGAAPSECVSS
jgi:hypothetical protein